MTEQLCPNQGEGPPPDAGEVAELVAWLLEKAVQAANADQPKAAGMLTWAAQVIGEQSDSLERQQPQPVSAATMRPMEFEDGRVGWYIDHPDFYCDLEPDESGAWSVYFRDRKTGKETLAAPQQGVPSKRIMKIAAETRKCILSWDCNARLLGNVTAEEIADLCDAILGAH